ncbi:hypothetical protein WG66_003948 [Moniliophthora roreri]|nr:hypothetical protein WG66_003948 [Moniliophthora roreri]
MEEWIIGVMKRGALQTQLNHVPLFKVKIKFISLATFDDRPSRGSQTLDADSAELRMALIGQISHQP